jgi:hypothetical protein
MPAILLGLKKVEIMQTLKTNPYETIFFSRPYGGFRLVKQTTWGDEYAAFAYCVHEAWRKLSKITGRSVAELKNFPLHKV